MIFHQKKIIVYYEFVSSQFSHFNLNIFSVASGYIHETSHSTTTITFLRLSEKYTFKSDTLNCQTCDILHKEITKITVLDL